MTDHSLAVKDIIKAGIDVYTSQGTIDALKLDSHRLHPVASEKQFKIGDWTILPLEINHDAPEPLGFLICNSDIKFLFITDSYYFEYKIPGLTHLAIECNYSEDLLKMSLDTGLVGKTLENRIRQSHFSLENVKKFMKANDLSKVQEIYLLHISESNGEPVYFQDEIQRLTGIPTYCA